MKQLIEEQDPMEKMECYTTQNHLKECESCGKGWEQIKEEFRKEFGNFQEPDEYTYNIGKTKDGFTQEDILTFFKPYFQERLHEEAKKELEISKDCEKCMHLENGDVVLVDKNRNCLACGRKFGGDINMKSVEQMNCNGNPCICSKLMEKIK